MKKNDIDLGFIDYGDTLRVVDRDNKNDVDYLICVRAKKLTSKNSDWRYSTCKILLTEKAYKIKSSYKMLFAIDLNEIKENKLIEGK